MRSSTERIIYARVRLEEAETHLVALRSAPGRKNYLKRLQAAREEVDYWKLKLVELADVQPPTLVPPIEMPQEASGAV